MTKIPVTQLALTMLAGLSIAPTAEAGCNCNRGQSMSTPTPMAMPMRAPMMHAPMMAPMMRPPMMSGPAYGPAMHGPPMQGCGPGGVRGGGAVVGRGTPPGTLGQTYILCSRPLPDDEHPRNAGLEIRTGHATDIVVEKMDGFRGEDGLWHFTTDKPWIPTKPAIVNVIIDRGGVRDVRVVRLIPGRILSVQF